MLTQTYNKKLTPTHGKFFKFQIKKAKSPIDNNDERHSSQKQILSLKRIKSAGKYKNLNQQNNFNSTSKLTDKIEVDANQDKQSRSLKNVFQKIRDKQQQQTCTKLNLLKQGQIQKQICLQFSEKIKCKNGVRSSEQRKQFNFIRSTEFKQGSTSKIFNKKQQKEKTSSLIQFRQENSKQLNINSLITTKWHLRQENHKYQDQYELFAKINLRNTSQNTKISPQTTCHLNCNNQQTVDSANISSSIQKINKLQKQLLKKNQLLKILQRRCAQNNLDGLKALQRSKSINQKRNSIHQQTHYNNNTNQISLKEYEKKNNELKNHIYYLQKRCEAMLKSNNTMKDQIQMKQKQVRNFEQKMLKVYHENLRYLYQLQNNKKRITELQAYQNQLLKKNLDLQVSFQIIKQQKQQNINHKSQINQQGKLNIERVLQYQNEIIENKEKFQQNYVQCSQNIVEQENFLDISRQIIKEVQKIQNQQKYFAKKRQNSASFKDICVLETNDELPKVDLFEKFYFQIGDLFSVIFEKDLYEYHDKILDQIQQFKSTIAELVSSIKIMTKRTQQSQQKQKSYQDQIRIFKCKIEKMIQQIVRNQYFLTTYQNLIQQLNFQHLTKLCQKSNEKYKQLQQKQIS